jgi:hypothetical protein
MFHHPRALPALMWSILALAACISPAPTASTPAEEMTADALFDQALLETQRYLGESRIELVQALVLLSLRQTGCGMKSSAWLHCGQACAMAIDLGLHNAGRVGQSGQKAGGVRLAALTRPFIQWLTLTPRPLAYRARKRGGSTGTATCSTRR